MSASIDPAIDQAIRFAQQQPFAPRTVGYTAVSMLHRVFELREEPPELLLHVVSVYSKNGFGGYGYVTDAVKGVGDCIRNAGHRGGIHPLISGLSIEIAGRHFVPEVRIAAISVLRTIATLRLWSAHHEFERSAIRWYLVQAMMNDEEAFQEISSALKEICALDDGIGTERTAGNDRVISECTETAKAFWENFRRSTTPHEKQIQEAKRQAWVLSKETLGQAILGVKKTTNQHERTIEEMTHYAREFRLFDVTQLDRSMDPDPPLERSPSELSSADRHSIWMDGCIQAGEARK